MTDGIAEAVARLQKLGVSKVLVNAMHPLACTPKQTRPLNHTECDQPQGDVAPSGHNKKLKEKLDPAHSDAVFVVDLYAAFTAIVNPSNSDTRASPSCATSIYTCKSCVFIR